MLLYAASVWALSASPRLEKQTVCNTKHLPLLHYRFLQNIPKAALQTITGIMPLHLKAQQEAIFIKVTCFRQETEFEGLSYQLRDYEEKKSRT
ncbi:hypothetical protein AVEN_229405-1 [Araneus ventricosus]|uniref:Uncharacterized protein n=1 Tax=Araneus ventricosus TaxID=182803 RepID=A0A4Y2M0X5_ARAVE|nr:hypothetical protein AVEN_229405-1 [Araneus ventricosus]